MHIELNLCSIKLFLPSIWHIEENIHQFVMQIYEVTFDILF